MKFKEADGKKDKTLKIQLDTFIVYESRKI